MLFLVAAIAPARAALSGADLHLSGLAQSLQIGGFASQGYLKSSANDYLGETSKGTFDFREYALNASWSTGKWRVGAQAFGEKLGSYGNDEVKLDWAMVDYQAAQWFGVRAGRVKLPRGLYNEALDLDSVRPFVLLPQSLYDNRLRDFIASFDGGMAYGNIDLKRFGSVDYKVYYGDTPMKPNTGASDYFNTDSPFKIIAIGVKSLAGGTLFWDTPINGLRMGYSHTTYTKLATVMHVLIPYAHVDSTSPKHTNAFNHDEFSVEFVRGDWTFATEAAHDVALYLVNVAGNLWLSDKTDLFYVSAARRINRWLELGSYYSISREHYVHNTNAIIPPLLKQGDYALSARFDLSDHLIFKIEGHYLDGAGKIFDTNSQPNPFALRASHWSMIAIKTTYSF
ncbi:MAG TPA: hypothetical protein VHD62_14195 [Opitutaceae bacterium]|nr:hypothetical protein [Opitutaceae bacterium]